MWSCFSWKASFLGQMKINELSVFVLLDISLGSPRSIVKKRIKMKIINHKLLYFWCIVIKIILLFHWMRNRSIKEPNWKNIAFNYYLLQHLFSISDISKLTLPWPCSLQFCADRKTSFPLKDESKHDCYQKLLLHLALYDSVIQSVFRKYVEKWVENLGKGFLFLFLIT